RRLGRREGAVPERRWPAASGPGLHALPPPASANPGGPGAGAAWLELPPGPVPGPRSRGARFLPGCPRRLAAPYVSFWVFLPEPFNLPASLAILRRRDPWWVLSLSCLGKVTRPSRAQSSTR